MPATTLAPMRLPTLLITLFTALSLFATHPARADDGSSQPESLPPTGQLTLTGSTALSNLVSLWAEAFSLRYPAVSLTVADPGSAVGLESLLNGSAEAVLTSTPLNKRQRQHFIDRYDYAPSTMPVALDGVAVFVNAANPLPQISLPQLDAVFSNTLRCGAQRPIRSWGELGVSGELARLPISTVGLTDNSGAYSLFRRKALCGGDFRPNFNAVPGPGGVQVAINRDRTAIGFASSALRDPGLRAIPVAHRSGEPATAPTAEAIRSGRYPLTRTLAIAYNLPPGREMAPNLRAFLDFARSAQGQAIAAKAGYVTLTKSPLSTFTVQTVCPANQLTT